MEYIRSDTIISDSIVEHVPRMLVGAHFRPSRLGLAMLVGAHFEAASMLVSTH